MKNSSNWRPSNLEVMWSEWLSPLKYLEPSMILSYPGSDISRRADQLFENTQFIQRELEVSNFEINVVDYRTERWSNASDFVRSIGEVNKCLRLIWIYGFEDMLKDGRKDLIIELQKVYRNSNQRLVLVCEANYYDGLFEKLILSLPSFDPRISLHGGYKDELLREFIDYLAKKWELVLEESLRERIVAEAGSSLRLIKLLTWHLRDKGIDKLDEALDSPQIWWQVRSLWHKLSENEKKVIIGNAYGLRQVENLAMSREYIKNMGFLEIPLLDKFVKKYVGNPLEVNTENDRLLIGGKDFTNHFTNKQSIILKMVLSRPGQYISREELIEALWSKDVESGSDWALDSQVSRLRQKLEEVGIGKHNLSTKRGKGLIWLS